MTIRATEPPALDVAGLSAAWIRRAREVSPEQLPLALALFKRLPTERWTLEWHLPWWLGHAFGLDAAIAREIVLSNLLGLGSIRLQDDLADGEVAPVDVVAATTLSAALYEAALAPYQAWFDASSPFWGHLDASMRTWRAQRHLAARGAPLKISPFAVCLLAERPGAYPALDRCLDHALEAMVRYDHVADWEADLDAGRWNAFVAAISPGPQLPGWRDRHRTSVRVAMLTTDAVADYFETIQQALVRSTGIAANLEPPVPPLMAHLGAFATDVAEHGSAIQARYHDLADQVAKLLLPAPVHGRS